MERSRLQERSFICKAFCNGGGNGCDFQGYSGSHGGYGYTEEFPVERYYRDARHLTMAEGTNEIQKLILGRDILGVSAFV